MLRFAKWTPDLDTFQGMTEVKNCIPANRNYEQFRRLLTSGDALSERPRGVALVWDFDGNPFIYVGDTTALYQRTSSSWTNVGQTYNLQSSQFWRFCQIEDNVAAVNPSDAPQIATIGGQFEDIEGAPKARTCGVIRDFLFLGNLLTPTLIPHAVRWSAIGKPRLFPELDTQAARANQSSREILQARFGAVNFIADGERTGLVLQERGIARFTYIGGDTVFQVDTFEKVRGAYTPNGNIQIDDNTYFISQQGFHVTNGVEVQDIGEEQVDETFLAEVNFDARERITVGADLSKKVIYWSFPVGSSSTPTRTYAYNYRENRWTNLDLTLEHMFSSVSLGTTLEDLDALFADLEVVTPDLDALQWKGGSQFIGAFGTDNRLGTFTGDPLTAIIDTPETEIVENRRVHVSGVKPIVAGAEQCLVSVGKRDNLNDDVLFAALVKANGRTGIAPARADAYYHRARVQIAGGFEKAIGVNFDAKESGI